MFNAEGKRDNTELIKPIFTDLTNINITPPNSIDENQNKNKKNGNEIKNYIEFFNSNERRLNDDISSKLNIIISNNDILQEQNILDSKSLTSFSTDNLDNKRKSIFSCKKRGRRAYDEDIHYEILPKENSDGKRKNTLYKKHDRMEKDNIYRKYKFIIVIF
jgi:hypothetical protein